MNNQILAILGIIAIILYLVAFTLGTYMLVTKILQKEIGGWHIAFWAGCIVLSPLIIPFVVMWAAIEMTTEIQFERIKI
jgi:hypothetical protein